MNTEQGIAAQLFWKLYAPLYDTIWDSPITSELSQMALKHIPVNGTIIDLGCGTGLMTRNYSQRVIGVDTSARMLIRAKRLQRIDEAVHRSADNTGLAARSATAVMISNLLHLHSDPRAVLSEATRICDSTGRIFLCWPLENPDTGTIYALDRSLGRSKLKATLAHELRKFIGTAAMLTRTTRNASAEIEREIALIPGFDIVLNTLMFDCQRVMVLARQRA